MIGQEQMSQSGAPFLVRKPTLELVDDVIKAVTLNKRGSKEARELPDHLASGILILQALISSLFQSDLEVKGEDFPLRKFHFPTFQVCSPLPGGALTKSLN